MNLFVSYNLINQNRTSYGSVVFNDAAGVLGESISTFDDINKIKKSIFDHLKSKNKAYDFSVDDMVVVNIQVLPIVLK